MGAVGTKAAHHVEVRLRPPVNDDPGEGLLFVARVHSAADGISKYRTWGEPQILGLWADDIVTISLYEAQTEEHFDAYQYNEVAELYVPWEVIEVIWRQSQPGEEMFFDLALSRTAPWLGANATLKQYRDAFWRAHEAAQADPGSVPRMCVGIREVQPHELPHEVPWEAATPLRDEDLRGDDGDLPGAGQSGARFGEERGQAAWRWPVHTRPEMAAPVLRAFEDLGPDDEHRVGQLQLRNQELRRQCTALGLRDVDVPDVEDRVRAHCDLFGRSASENAQLRDESQALERELANVYGEAELPGDLRGADEDAARQCAGTMQEIRRVIQHSIELSGQCSGHLRQLEEDVSAASAAPPPQYADADDEVDQLRRLLGQQHDEHEAVLVECSRLESLLEVAAGEAQAQRSEAEERRCEELGGRCRQLYEEVEALQQQLRDRPELRDSEDGMLPATVVLTDEVEHLQAQLAEQQRRRAQEQVEMEQRPGQLRRETRALQEKLQETLEARERADRELERLQQSHERELEELRSTAVERAAATRAREEKELVREALSKDAARSRRRIEFFDQKVQQLLAESQDLRQRAELAWQSVPDTPEHAGAEAGALQEQLSAWQSRLQACGREREALQGERDRARQELENSLVEARVAEQKLRLLRDRTAPKPLELLPSS